ncbi:MAG: 5'-nucleotidase C-terminal domain-containing protein [Chitinophagales bacterium]
MRYTYIYIVSILLCASLWSCKVNHVAEYQYGYTKIDSTYTSSDSHIEEMIAPYKADLDATMNEVIATSKVEMSKAKPESLLGNLLADATLEIGQKYHDDNVDIGIVNYGGIRVPSLSAGNVTLGNVYEIMPFDNYLVILEVKGNILQDALNSIAVRGGWPISGVTYTIKNDEAIHIYVGEEKLDENRVYKIAISDYIANGGDKMSMFKPLIRTNTNVLLRDAFIEYFKTAKEVDASIENRVVIEE